MLPADLTSLDLLAEPAVLLPSPGHYADKQTVPGRDLLQVVVRSQLAIRHVDEIDSPQELLQCLVICRMETVITLVSRADLMRERYSAIRGYRKPQHQLLQIRSMVFVLTVRQQLLHTPTWIPSGKRHRGGVVMHLPPVESEDLDCSESQVEEHVVVPRVVEPGQCPAHLVVLDKLALCWREPELLCIQWFEPILQFIQGDGCRENVVDQNRERFVIVEAHAFIGPHVRAHDLADSELFDKVLNDRVGTHDEFGQCRILLQTALNLNHALPCVTLNVGQMLCNNQMSSEGKRQVNNVPRQSVRTVAGGPCKSKTVLIWNARI